MPPLLAPLIQPRGQGGIYFLLVFAVGWILGRSGTVGRTPR